MTENHLMYNNFYDKIQAVISRNINRLEKQHFKFTIGCIGSINITKEPDSDEITATGNTNITAKGSIQTVSEYLAERACQALTDKISNNMYKL